MRSAFIRFLAHLQSGIVLLFLLNAGGWCHYPARAGSVPVNATDAHERTLAVHSYAAEKLWMWQQRLKLADWKLDLKVVRSSDLKPKTLGNIHWDSRTKDAVIRVLDPADYKLANEAMLRDIEFTIVHELIHLQLSSLPRSEASRRAEEHAVNNITEALLKLSRQ